ncbi:hypothetical protein M5689_001876 [Euphorbia peplus]|nr:hypothetical protein M5689_001876 [Euphorbia peplus]
MASSSRKNNKCVLSEGERPRFYKIILDDTIREKKLSIPRKFVRNYGHLLSSRVMLKVPSEDDDVSLEILDHFSPSRQEKVKSQILLPTSPHKIKPKCSAKTFDPHCPINEVEVAAEPQVPKDESDGIPVEISYQFSPSRKRKEKSPTPSSSWSHKTIKIVEDFTNVTGKGTEKKENRSFQKEMGARSCSQPQIPTFEIKMKPSHILDRKSTPDIAASFALKYMKRDEVRQEEFPVAAASNHWAKKLAAKTQRLPASNSSESKKSTSVDVLFKEKFVNLPMSFIRHIEQETEFIKLKVKRTWF